MTVHAEVSLAGRLTCACVALLTSLAAVAGQAGGTADAAGFRPLESLGMQQGRFAIEVLQKAGGEHLFPRTLTPRQAAEALAGIGFAPKQGWAVDQPLTWRDLNESYRRLLAMLNVEDALLNRRDVAVLVRVTPVVPRPGEVLHAEFAVGNVGMVAATNLQIEIGASRGIGMLPPAPAGYQPATGLWSMERLDPGAVCRLALSFKVEPGTDGQRLQVVAQLRNPEPHEANSGSHKAIASLVVSKAGQAVADVGLSLGADNLLPATGDDVVFTLSVTNRGLATATGLVISNAVPAGLKRVRYAPSWPNGYGLLPDIAPQGGLTLCYTAEVGRVASDIWVLTNFVNKITMNELDAEPANDADRLELLVRFMERLTAAVQRAIVPTTTERQPVSPSRPLRR